MASNLTRPPPSVNGIHVARRSALGAAVLMVATFHNISVRAETCYAGFLIALDVGHTLTRPGATSAYGTSEFNYNRRLATAVDRRLQDRGVSTVLIGQDGRPIGLTERTAIAAEAGASVFMSIHHDSVQPHYLSTWFPAGIQRSYSDVFSGYSLFVSVKPATNLQSRRLAEALGDALLESGQTPSHHHSESILGERHPLLDPRRGIYSYDELAVLRSARMPAVLLEAAIIVNRRDEEVLRSPEGLEPTVAAVTQAILSYCSVRPKTLSAESAEPAPRRPAASVKRP